jgi:hypothetical protein
VKIVKSADSLELFKALTRLSLPEIVTACSRRDGDSDAGAVIRSMAGNVETKG